jgi:AraC-like DNA-binding protein
MNLRSALIRLMRSKVHFSSGAETVAPLLPTVARRNNNREIRRLSSLNSTHPNRSLSGKPLPFPCHPDQREGSAVLASATALQEERGPHLIPSNNKCTVCPYGGASTSQPHSAFPAKEPPDPAGQLANPVKYIRLYCREDTELERLSQIAGMSRSSLHRQFKLQAGMTVTDYVSQLRIGNACAFLINTDKPVSLIAGIEGTDGVTPNVSYGGYSVCPVFCRHGGYSVWKM